MTAEVFREGDIVKASKFLEDEDGCVVELSIQGKLRKSLYSSGAVLGIKPYRALVNAGTGLPEGDWRIELIERPLPNVGDRLDYNVSLDLLPGSVIRSSSGERFVQIAHRWYSVSNGYSFPTSMMPTNAEYVVIEFIPKEQDDADE